MGYDYKDLIKSVIEPDLKHMKWFEFPCLPRRSTVEEDAMKEWKPRTIKFCNVEPGSTVYLRRKGSNANPLIPSVDGGGPFKKHESSSIPFQFNVNVEDDVELEVLIRHNDYEPFLACPVVGTDDKVVAYVHQVSATDLPVDPEVKFDATFTSAGPLGIYEAYYGTIAANVPQGNVDIIDSSIELNPEVIGGDAVYIAKEARTAFVEEVTVTVNGMERRVDITTQDGGRYDRSEVELEERPGNWNLQRLYEAYIRATAHYEPNDVWFDLDGGRPDRRRFGRVGVKNYIRLCDNGGLSSITTRARNRFRKVLIDAQAGMDAARDRQMVRLSEDMIAIVNKREYEAATEGLLQGVETEICEYLDGLFEQGSLRERLSFNIQPKDGHVLESYICEHIRGAVDKAMKVWIGPEKANNKLMALDIRIETPPKFIRLDQPACEQLDGLTEKARMVSAGFNSGIMDHGDKSVGTYPVGPRVYPAEQIERTLDMDRKKFRERIYGLMGLGGDGKGLSLLEDFSEEVCSLVAVDKAMKAWIGPAKALDEICSGENCSSTGSDHVTIDDFIILDKGDISFKDGAPRLFTAIELVDWTSRKLATVGSRIIVGSRDKKKLVVGWAKQGYLAATSGFGSSFVPINDVQGVEAFPDSKCPDESLLGMFLGYRDLGGTKQEIIEVVRWKGFFYEVEVGGSVSRYYDENWRGLIADFAEDPSRLLDTTLHGFDWEKIEDGYDQSHPWGE